MGFWGVGVLGFWGWVGGGLGFNCPGFGGLRSVGLLADCVQGCVVGFKLWDQAFAFHRARLLALSALRV